MCIQKTQANAMTDKNNILYLFDRPTEPIFTGKGEDNVSFDIPADYYVSQIQNARTILVYNLSLTNDFGKGSCPSFVIYFVLFL